MEKEIWCSRQKQGNRNLYTISTRDKQLHNTMIASPELLEALEMLCDPDWYRVDPVGFAEAQRKARSALAKAKGE